MSPFTRENYIDAIKNALAYLKSQVELNNAINKYSINIEAETFYAGFLNVIYGFRLKNGNHTEKNIPSIDLYEECQRDDGQRVAVQVTSNNDVKKVKKTLESFCTYGYQKDYTRLIILMITQKKPYRSAFSFPADIGVQFNQKRDIVDVYDLIQNIEQTTETDHLRSIYEYLAKELPSWIIRIGDTEDKRPRETELYDRLFSIFENDRKDHPSIRMIDPVPSLFPKGLPEILSDGRLAVEDVEEKEKPRAIKEMILDSWKREDRKHILLIGKGGIGKTVAMLTLPVEDWFKELRIPVIYVPLQKLDAFSGDLNRYIREKIGYDNYDICIQQANSISKGQPRLLLLLDGFNEIPDDYKKLAAKQIQEWMKRPGIQIITTSRLGFFIEKYFLKYQLKPLPFDTVRSFLLSAGIVEEQLPRKNERIWEVINVPLMLTIYTQIEKVREAADRFSEGSIFEWKDPFNAAHIIWNYLQMDLYRCIKKDDPSYSAPQYASAILAIAPYICCQMCNRNKFYLKREDFHELIQDAMDFFSARKEFLENQIWDVRDEFAPYEIDDLFQKENVAKYARILIDNIGLFQTQKIRIEGQKKRGTTEYLCSLMHQNFRDALAAFFICSCLSKTCDAKEKRTLLDQADHYVKDYMAQYFSDQELVSIWDRHRIEDPEDGQITFILMDLIGRQRKYDYRELNLSGIDLTKTNLHRLLSKRLDICPLPSNRNKFSNTKVSVNCLSPNGHTTSINCVAFSPDGRQLASASGGYGSNNSTIRIWNLGSGESRVFAYHAGAVSSAAISPDGRYLATGANDSTVRIWNLGSGESRVLEGHTGQIESVVYSLDGRHLASGASDSTVRIWDLASGESRVLEGHAGRVMSVAYSPDGRHLTTGASDGTVRVWDLASGESRVLEGHTGQIESVVYSPDGRLLVSGASDSTVWIWDFASGESCVLEDHADRVNSVTFSFDGRQLASGTSDGTIRIWDIESGESHMLEGHKGYVPKVAFISDGSRLVGGASDRTMRIWNLEGGESRVLDDYAIVVSIAFSPGGKWLASGTDDNTVRIWDLASGERLVLGDHKGHVYSVAFSSDGRQLSSGASDGTIQIWDIESGESRVLEGHAGFVYSVAYSPDGRHLASGASDSTARIWDLASGENRVLQSWWEGGEVSSVAFSPDGRHLATGSEDGMVRIWDIENGEIFYSGLHAGWVNSVAYSPDGRQLASGSDDRTVRIWDIANMEKHVLEGHEYTVWSVAYSPDGRYLASGSEDGTVRIWELEEYQEVEKYVIIPHINLNGANFELAIIDEKDKEMLRAAGAKV